MPDRIAIIGAGMAGATCANELIQRGYEVTVLEKAANIGGRMATRAVSKSKTNFELDVGAQYFTARDAGFKQWIEQAGLPRWNPSIADATGEAKRPTLDEPWFVGTPAMNDAVSLLLASARTVVSTEIASIRRTPRGTFALVTPDANPSMEQHEFDVVVVATAPTDAATLVAPHAERLAAYARAAKVSPCWAASIVTQSSGQSKAPDLIIPSKDTPLGWIARNASKPGRSQSHVAELEGWVAHATAEWSADHLSDTPDNASTLLVDAFTRATRYATGAAPDIVHTEAQLWRQAKAARAPDGTPPAAMENGIVLCGDYLIAGRVEAAYLSGKAAARLVSGG